MVLNLGFPLIDTYLVCSVPILNFCISLFKTNSCVFKISCSLSLPVNLSVVTSFDWSTISQANILMLNLNTCSSAETLFTIICAKGNMSCLFRFTLLMSPIETVLVNLTYLLIVLLLLRLIGKILLFLVGSFENFV